jgi:hypothetical protein
MRVAGPATQPHLPALDSSPISRSPLTDGLRLSHILTAWQAGEVSACCDEPHTASLHASAGPGSDRPRALPLTQRRQPR